MSKEIYELFACREIILQCLLIKNTQVSHYTSINVAKQIFKKENENKNLRLSLLTVSNDPTEGEILLNYLNVSEKFQKRPKYPFGTCFTFELDSLNQLRLYGKENNEKATGIALVLSSIFFSQNRSFSQSLQGISSEKKVQVILSDGKSVPFKSSDEKKFIKDNQGSLLPLYRCIYLAENEEKEEELIDLVMDIILPIQYLTKDIAFQEERECRILKTVSDINRTNENIEPDDAISSVYIDYEVPLDEHLEYAIIHEKQKTKAPYLERHLKTQVKISRNPYRR